MRKKRPGGGGGGGEREGMEFINLSGGIFYKRV